MASPSVIPLRRGLDINQISTIANAEMTRLYRVKAILDLCISVCADQAIGEENIVMFPALEQASEMVLASVNALDPVSRM